jgi:uncharacterized protein YndB with AHSA1/START domain
MSEQQQAAKAIVTTPSEREIRAERVFDAPRELVYKAFTDPELIPQWWGPRGVTTIVDQMDVRVGGSWRFVCRNPEGREDAFHGTFRDLTPPERAQQTFEWEGMPGYVCLETAELHDLGDGRTKLVTTTLFFTHEERDGMLGTDMEVGMNESYDRLDELLARLNER